MNTRKRAFAVVGVLFLGALGLYLPHLLGTPARANSASETPDMGSALPRIGVSAEAARAITKIEITQPSDTESRRLETLALERRGDGWTITAPTRTTASAPKVRELLDNMQSLTVSAVFDPGSASYDEHDLTSEKALHVVAFQGTTIVTDLYFGKSDPRGQLARIAGVEGVFTVPNTQRKGYEGFLYQRSLRNWRETTMVHFAPADVTSVQIENRNGLLSFVKNGEAWSGSASRRGKDGTLGASEPFGPRFEGGKVDDFLAAYKAVSADDFGDERDRAESGVDDAQATGGLIRVRVQNRASEIVLAVGRAIREPTRWAIAASRWATLQGGDGTLFTLSPWLADWATADASRFASRTTP